jgi:hypothetical protein
MEALNPSRLQSGEGVQLDFAEAVEEDPFGLGPTDPLQGLGLVVATSTAEKDVGMSGFRGGGLPRRIYMCLWYYFPRIIK